MTTYEEINEVLNYGTDAQIRATLEAVADQVFRRNYVGHDRPLAHSAFDVKECTANILRNGNYK